METTTARIDSMEPDMTLLRPNKSCPLEFCYVKMLFYQQHYRQCIQTCREILDVDSDGENSHPLQQTFMRLYIALAHDDLARAMHDFSSTKLSAFDQAEFLYKEAAVAIPGGEQFDHLLRVRGATLETQDEPKPQTPLPQSESQSTINSEVFRRPPSPSPFLSPPTRPYTTDLPNITSPGSSDSDTDDELESHDSFGRATTPQRIPRLPSTFSSMSLLEDQKQTRGLLRPVRHGSIAKPYQPPQKSSPSPKQYRSRLPRLNTSHSLVSPQHTPPRQSSPVRKQLRSPDENWDVPPSPVSPLGSAYIPDDDRTISPISPTTPVDMKPDGDPFTSVEFELPDGGLQSESGFAEHAEGLRKQIATQISLLQEARERTVAAQEERAVKNNTRKLPAARASINSGGMQQSRSFWLFTPEDHKALDKQQRIQEGRRRTWARSRFDPSRYQALAEKALGEL